jgi:predicted ATPase
MEDYLNKIAEIPYKMDFSSVTILTGRNAGGKSLIRKQLVFALSEKLDIPWKKLFIPHASLQLRTEPKPEMGALAQLASDLPWIASSASTIEVIKKVFSNKDKANYIIIDEPEIGLGIPLQLGLCDYINEQIEECKKLGIGVLVITHSKTIVENIKHENFINLEDMDENEWLTHIPQKISIEEFEKFSGDFFVTVRDRMNQNK